MRKDRYITNDEVADIDRLTSVSWGIDLKNTVSIKWSWPRNGGIKLAAVFVADSAEDTLESLLEKRLPVIITKDMDKSYSKPLELPACMYRVFPAHFGEGSDIILLNQKSGNTTDIITRVVTAAYTLEYKPLPLSEYQRVSISIRCSDTPPPRAFAYAKYRNGARICEYPLSSTQEGAYECYIGKNETISLYVADEYKKNVFLS